MRTADVKVFHEYLYSNKEITVMKRIAGAKTTKCNMQSGELFTGFKRRQKKFLLSNGETVYAKHLTQITIKEEESK